MHLERDPKVERRLTGVKSETSGAPHMPQLDRHRLDDGSLVYAFSHFSVKEFLTSLRLERPVQRETSYAFMLFTNQHTRSLHVVVRVVVQQK